MQLGNGRWESTQFNSRLQPTQIALGTVQNATDKLKLDFEYGTLNTGTGQVINGTNNGNVAKQTITVPTETRGGTTYDSFSATQYYVYDSLNRIQIASENLTPNGQSTYQSWQQTFTYDRYGNRNFDEANTTTLPKNCGTSPNFTVCTADKKILNPSISTSNNRIIQDQDGDSQDDYLFDSSGNTTKDAQGRTFIYDAENKQIEVKDSQNQTIGQYFYDGDGKRVKKYVPSTGETTTFIYDAGGKLVAEYSTAIASQQDAKVSYLTSDHLGSPRINTDQNGTVTARHDYQPFGEEIQRASYGADSVRKQFTGYERDNETDLDYAKARMFESGFGRFTSPDPLLVSGRIENPQSWNRYVYVLNNPLVYTDPTGLWEWGTEAGGSATNEQLEENLKNKDKKVRKAAETALKFRKRFKEALEIAKGAANSNKLNQAQKDAIARAVNSYGTENDGNNVFVSVKEQGSGTGANTNGTAGDLIFVDFDPESQGNALAIDIAHEGSHVADNQDFDKWLGLGFGMGKGKRPFDLTKRQTETRAYNVSSFIAQALDVSPYLNYPNDFAHKYQIWNNSWKKLDEKQIDQKRQDGIRNILNDQGGYKKLLDYSFSDFEKRW